MSLTLAVVATLLFAGSSWYPWARVTGEDFFLIERSSWLWFTKVDAALVVVGVAVVGLLAVVAAPSRRARRAIAGLTGAAVVLVGYRLWSALVGDVPDAPHVTARPASGAVLGLLGALALLASTRASRRHRTLDRRRQ